MTFEKITISNSIPAHVAGPKGKNAVVVLQEWWGITDEILAQAKYVQETTGCRVCVPDLYKGKIGVNAEEAHHLMDGLDFPTAVKEIGECVKYLRGEGASKVACIGFCMGGVLSLASGQHAGVDSVVAFYGTPPAQLAQPENIKVPAQLHSGEEDAFKGLADKETVTNFAKKMPHCEQFLYPGEGHAFMNAGKDAIEKQKTGGMPVGKKESQDLAWSRVFAFFNKHLA